MASINIVNETEETVLLEVGNVIVREIRTIRVIFDVTFTVSDIIAGQKSIGVIPAGMTVEKVAVIITDVFDNSQQMTVGDTDAQGRLMTISEIAMEQADIYCRDCFEIYAEETALFAYFVYGTAPTAGAGRMLIYYS